MIQDILSYGPIFAPYDEEEAGNRCIAQRFQYRGPFGVKRYESEPFFQRGLGIVSGAMIFRNLKKFGGARGYLYDGRIDIRGAFPGQEDVVKTEDFSATKDGADVMRIFHIIEQNESIAGD